MHYIVKLTNATVIGFSKTKLDDTVLNSEIEIEGYDLVKFDQSRRRGRVAFLLKTLSRIIGNLIFVLAHLFPMHPFSTSRKR